VGRRSLLDKCFFTVEDVVTAYEEGDVKSAAKHFKTSTKTIRKYLKLGGLTLKRGPRKGQPHKSRHYSAFADWLRQNPKVVLPRSPSKIAEVTGCSLDAVKGYLYRRRLDLRKHVDELIEKGLPATLTDSHGRARTAESIHEYQVHVDFANYCVVMDIVGKLGEKDRLFFASQDLYNLFG